MLRMTSLTLPIQVRTAAVAKSGEWRVHVKVASALSEKEGRGACAPFVILSDLSNFAS